MENVAGSTISRQCAGTRDRTKLPLEWNCIQGHFESEKSGRRDFVVHLLRWFEGGAGGAQLALGVCNPGTGRFETLTWVEPGFHRLVIRELRAGRCSLLDPGILGGLCDELERFGPLAPAQLRAEPARAVGAGGLMWNGFAFRRLRGGVHLRLPALGADEAVDLHIAEARIPDFLDPFADLQQDTRCESGCGRVTGDGGDGWAWLHRRQLPVNWIFGAGRGMGWDAFHVDLGNGNELAIAQLRETGSGHVISKHGAILDSEGVANVDEFNLTAIRHWESRDSYARYPVQWKIEIPGRDLSLEFQPQCDGQELAFGGPLLGIWDGAGLAIGHAGSRSLRAPARAQLAGYASVPEFGQFIARMAERVDRHLDAFLPRHFTNESVERFVGAARWAHEPAAITETIASPVWDLIGRKGKRWRPLFGIFLLDTLGASSDEFAALICTVSELIHTGALAIDDIEDNSQLRRGEACLHLRYGLDVALNAGNALYFLPVVALFEQKGLSDAQRLRIHEIKERLCIEAHFGQATDIYWSRRLSPAALAAWIEEDIESKILQMYEFKTAAGAKALAALVAVLAGANDELTLACTDFARAFAVSFQIIDDIHNFSTSPRWTKTRGEDIANGKLTYVIAAALRRLLGAERTRLAGILSSGESRGDPAEREAAISLVARSGALEDCRTQARSMTMAAWDVFSAHVPPSTPKLMLHAMCLKMLDLAYDT